MAVAESYGKMVQPSVSGEDSICITVHDGCAHQWEEGAHKAHRSTRGMQMPFVHLPFAPPIRMLHCAEGGGNANGEGHSQQTMAPPGLQVQTPRGKRPPPATPNTNPGAGDTASLDRS